MLQIENKKEGRPGIKAAFFLYVILTLIFSQALISFPCGVSAT